LPTSSAWAAISFKTFFSGLANPASRIREIIPRDYLDLEPDILPAEYYLSGSLRLRKCADLEPYHPRVMNTILRRHHRNVIFAALISYLLLLLMGAFSDQPMLRVPAGAGFLLLFAIVLGIVGAFKYFMKSWETLGWIILFLVIASHGTLPHLRSAEHCLRRQLQNAVEPAAGIQLRPAAATVYARSCTRPTKKQKWPGWTNGKPGRAPGLSRR
jgi:hypothetical protein